MRKIFYLVIISLFLNTSFASLENVTNSYISQLKLFQKETHKAEKQAAFNKTKEYSKILLGVIQGMDIKFLNKTNKFYNLLSQKAVELQKEKLSEDKKIALKANRDITNLNEISKYLKCCLKLLNVLYNDPEIIDLILSKVPEFVPQLGKEISIALRIFELVITKPNENFNDAIEKMRDFARQSEDGTYLLSPILSAGMKNNDIDSLDFKKIIQETDFSDLDLCDYLNIK